MLSYLNIIKPVSFNNVWIKPEERRHQDFSVILRVPNSDDFFILTALLAQTEKMPYCLFSRM